MVTETPATAARTSLLPNLTIEAAGDGRDSGSVEIDLFGCGSGRQREQRVGEDAVDDRPPVAEVHDSAGAREVSLDPMGELKSADVTVIAVAHLALDASFAPLTNQRKLRPPKTNFGDRTVRALIRGN